MRKLKPRAERVPGAERTWCFDADRVKLKSGPPFTPTQFDENLKSKLMKKAILQLGVVRLPWCYIRAPSTNNLTRELEITLSLTISKQNQVIFHLLLMYQLIIKDVKFINNIYRCV